MWLTSSHLVVVEAMSNIFGYFVRYHTVDEGNVSSIRRVSAFARRLRSREQFVVGVSCANEVTLGRS